MKMNTTRRLPVGLTPPAVPKGLCGPEALAELLIESRKLEPTTQGPISDEGVRRLVNLVYYASLLPEEGRFSQYKISCQLTKGSINVVTEFEPTQLNSVGQIKRLAPACAHVDCAILVAERDDLLWLDGIVNIGGMSLETVPGYPGVIGVGTSIDFRLEVLGPGHLRCSESFWSRYEIRAGSIRALCGYDHPKPVQSLINSLQSRVSRELCVRLGEEASQIYGARILDWRPMLQLLSTLLKTAADARRGGAFVFLPEDQQDPSACGLKILHRTVNLDLGEDLIEQWLTCLQSAQQYGSPERDNTLRRSQWQRSRLITNTEAAGHLSCVDGCVVLTREFRVLGFGAKIDAPLEQAEGSPRRFKHISSGAVYEDKEFMAAIGGTRHQSSARLCQIHANIGVFTISQDGDMKFFTSDDHFAYVYGPLDLPTILNQIHV